MKRERESKICRGPKCRNCGKRFVLFQGKYTCKCGEFTFQEMLQQKQDARKEE